MENKIQIKEKRNSEFNDNTSDKFHYIIPAEKSTNSGVTMDNQGLELVNDNTLGINKSDISVSGNDISNNRNKIPLQIKLEDINNPRKSDNLTFSDKKKGNERLSSKSKLALINSINPFDYLQLAQKATVKQAIDKKVFMSGCEPPIRYYIHITTFGGEKMKIFKAKEVSTWCAKNCCQ
jgi:hypothetical protein